MRIELPVLSFSVGTYWNRFYRDEPWFDQRYRWAGWFLHPDRNEGRGDGWREGRNWDDRDRYDRYGRDDRDRRRSGEWRNDDDESTGYDQDRPRNRSGSYERDSDDRNDMSRNGSDDVNWDDADDTAWGSDGSDESEMTGRRSRENVDRPALQDSAGKAGSAVTSGGSQETADRRSNSKETAEARSGANPSNSDDRN